ncbi:flavodoxin domain-containing protein [Deltaproteobacteria bacterium]|nr:flavodoxin domain-containing protein [Deltaproteobacteria bacterium]
MERRKFIKVGLAGLSTIALADNALALEFYPQPSDKKWAVLYGTWCGSSRDAGIWISEGMGGIADVFDVRENPELRGFDHFVVGGSIRHGKTRQELIDYMGKNQGWMKGRIRGLFAICDGSRGDMDQKMTDYIDNHIAKICGVSNVPSRLFAGRTTAALLEPEIIARYDEAGEMIQDSDDLKRSECLAFGREILDGIGQG